MPVAGRKYAFTKQNADNSPDEAGVYSLHDGGKVIYYGKAADITIRKRLQSHRRGDEGSCTKAATHFKCELTSRLATRERELLVDYKTKHGKLPLCNEQNP